MESRPVELGIVASMQHRERIYRLEAGAPFRIPKQRLEGAEHLDGDNILRTAAAASG